MKNIYQKLAEMIQKSPRLLGSGGLFGGIKEDHTFFGLFAEYIKKEKLKHHGVPKTVSVNGFVAFLRFDAGKSEEETKEIEKKLLALKSKGEIDDDPSKSFQNTFYNLGLILEELGFSGDTKNIISRYDEALKHSLQGDFGYAAESTVQGANGTVKGDKVAEVANVTGSTAIGSETAEVAQAAESEAHTAESEAHTAESEAHTAESAETLTGESKETAKVSATEIVGTTGTATFVPSDYPLSPLVDNAKVDNAKAAEEKSEEKSEEQPKRETTVSEEATPSENEISTSVESEFERSPVGTEIKSKEIKSTYAPVSSRPKFAVAGRDRGLMAGTRKKIAPMRTVEIIGADQAIRMAGNQKTRETEAQLQFEQSLQGQIAGSQGTYTAPGKKKSAGLRIAKYAGLGTSSSLILPLLGGGGSAEAATEAATRIGTGSLEIFNFIIGLLF